MTHLVDRRGVALRAVRAVPGAHLRALERLSRLSLGTLRHHLGALVDDRVVLLERDRRYARYYPAEMPRPARRAWDALRQRRTRLIVADLLQGPCPQARLASGLGLPAATVHMYARRLEALGVAVDGPGGLRLVEPAAVRAVLASLRPTALDQLTDGAIDLFDALG